ncbi:integrase domain-containing protein [Paraburkholderia nemoris]
MKRRADGPEQPAGYDRGNQVSLDYCQEHDFELITGSGKALKSAMNRLKALLRRAGMVGQVSFHSLRNTYALTAASEMLYCGIAPYEVLVQLSERMRCCRSTSFGLHNSSNSLAKPAASESGYGKTGL